LEVWVWAKRRESGFQRWPFSQRRKVDIWGEDNGFRVVRKCESLSEGIIERLRREDGEGVLTIMGKRFSSSIKLLIWQTLVNKV
jgi:hypothetical protein